MSLSQAEKAAAMHAKAEVEQLRKLVTETAAVAHTESDKQEEPPWFKEQDAAVDAALAVASTANGNRAPSPSHADEYGYVMEADDDEPGEYAWGDDYSI